MINRLLSVPLSPVAFNIEVDTIKCISQNNGIKLDVDNIIRKKLTARALDATTSLPHDNKVRKKERWLRQSYIRIFSDNLCGVLKIVNCRPAYYPLNTIHENLYKLKDAIPQTQRSGVYRIMCGDCPATYIGETGRQISIRFKENCDAFTKNRPKKSAFAAHILGSGHSIPKERSLRTHCKHH